MKTMTLEHSLYICRSIGDLPQDVIENHSLTQKHATVYFQGSVSDPESFAIATPYEPGEVTCYGVNLGEIFDSLCDTGKFDGFVLETSSKEALIGRFGQKYGKKLTSSSTCTYTLLGGQGRMATDAILVGKQDSDLIARASEHFDWYGFHSVEEMLEAGFIAGVVRDNELVSVAYTSAFSPRYVDIGVRTRCEYRGKGYATASAAMVLEALRPTGKTPVWNVTTDNGASIRICRKLGFRKVYEKSYLCRQ